MTKWEEWRKEKGADNMSNIGMGATITVESTGQSWHTQRDWGLAIGNNDYIGDPVQETNYIDIPGASCHLDASEALTGRPVFKHRPIKILFGGMRQRTMWDNVISEFRNQIEGRVIHITFDNDPNYYWRGRVNIANFDRVRELGKFYMEIPTADPYKYDVFTSEDDWEWDSFDFEYGVVRYIGTIDITSDTIITTPRGGMEVVPIFDITYINGSSLEVYVDETKKYPLSVGENRIPQIKVGGSEEVTLRFAGAGQGSIKYRGGSL